MRNCFDMKEANTPLFNREVIYESKDSESLEEDEDFEEQKYENIKIEEDYKSKLQKRRTRIID